MGVIEKVKNLFFLFIICLHFSKFFKTTSFFSFLVCIPDSHENPRPGVNHRLLPYPFAGADRPFEDAF